MWHRRDSRSTWRRGLWRISRIGSLTRAAEGMRVDHFAARGIYGSDYTAAEQRRWWQSRARAADEVD